MTDDVLTARDLYAAVLAMENDPAVTDRSLQSCLGSLHTLAGAWFTHSRIPFASFVALLREPFDGVPRAGARPQALHASGPQARAFATWQTTIVGQVSDLRAMDLDRTGQGDTMDNEAGRPVFAGAPNVAMKIPKADYEATVAFYRDGLGLPVTAETDAHGVDASHRVDFGPFTLWLDRVDRATHAELWLQTGTDDVGAGLAHLTARHGTQPCDEIEPLPTGAAAHWIRDPAGVVHLLGSR